MRSGLRVRSRMVKTMKNPPHGDLSPHHQNRGSLRVLYSNSVTRGVVEGILFLVYASGSSLETTLLIRPKDGMLMLVLPQDRQFREVPVRGGIHRLINLAL